jgi:capsular exopolysaccharide synthesis family protein
MQVKEDADRGTDLDLRHYLRVIGRRRWVIIAVVVLVAAAALASALSKEDRYRASAELLLLSPTPVEANAQQISDEPDRAIANEIEILGSADMQAAVADAIGDSFPDVSADTTGDNDVVRLTSESDDPEAAAEAVNTYAQAYERLRRQRTVQALRVELGDVQANRNSKRDQLDALLAPITELTDRINEMEPGPERDALIAQRSQAEDGLTGLRDSIIGQIGELDQQVHEIQGAMRNPTGGVNVLNPATVPSEPFYPQPKKDLIVGLIVGLLIGLAAAFVWEQLDDAVRGRADADRATNGLPILGLVPRVSGWRNRTESRLVTRDDPRSSAAESYRSLVTSLEFIATDAAPRVILFTSPGASEGKTTTVANVGIAFAEAGHRTVLVDADLRRPRLHAFFGLEASVGMSTVLAGKIDIATAVQSVEGEHPLHLVAAGPIAPNPAELLRTDTVDTALTKLSESFDVVVVDSPPVLPVADALVLSRYIDVVVLLASADNTGRRKLSRAVEALRQVDAPLRGIVLNGVGAAEGDEYGYYGDDENGTPRRRGGRRSRRKARR